MQRHHVAAEWGSHLLEGLNVILVLIQRANEVAHCNFRQPHVCNPSCVPKYLDILPEVVIILRMTKTSKVFGAPKHALDGTNVRGSEN